jgi:hypothetical protein
VIALRKIEVCAAAIGTAFAVSISAQAPEIPIGQLLDRIADRVEHYYEHAQNIVCLETVRLQPLRTDLLSDGFPRRLTYELRVAWDPPDEPGTLPEANVLRQLLTVGGKAPKPGDEPKCMDPKPISPEPLQMLLPGQRDDYAFTLKGHGRTDGRDALMIDYKSIEKGEPTITWKDDCASISLPGRSAGRIWVDQDTYDVLRMDDRLVGQFDFDTPPSKGNGYQSGYMVIERSQSSIRYRPVAFTDPDETLMLPASIENLQVVRNSGQPRMRITQTFTGYRRFLTDAHILSEP